MKNILAENMRRFGTKNLNEQQGTDISDEYTQVGQSKVRNAKITGNTMQFEFDDLDPTTKADVAAPYGEKMDVVLNNIKFNPATDRTHERYTVPSVDDISITLTADSAVPGALVNAFRRKLFFYFEE
jgi:hypothetical protein